MCDAEEHGGMRGGRLAKLGALAWIAAALLVAVAPAALADPASDLGDAESQVAAAETDVGAAESEADGARAAYSAAAQKAKPVEVAAKSATSEARQTRAQLRATQRSARREIASLEAAHTREEEDHDDEVASAFGLGLAALVAAAIAFAWTQFKTSRPVGALARLSLAQALGLCLGGGLLLIVVGAAIGSGDGVARAIGTFLFWLGLILPTAFLLARRAAQRRGGEGESGSGGVPDWVPNGLAALFLLLGLTAFGVAVLSDGPSALSVPDRLNAEAEALEVGPGAARLEREEEEAAAARKRAAAPVARKQAAARELRAANGDLRGAKRRLASAQADERSAARRLAVLVEREEQEATRQAQREAEELATIEEEASSGCEPGYSPCVPTYPPDVDCSEVAGPVSVTGSDPHGLDADGDGVGCE